MEWFVPQKGREETEWLLLRGGGGGGNICYASAYTTVCAIQCA